MIKKVSEQEQKEFNKKAVHPLQTWEWGSFREETGNKVVRLGVYKKKKLTESIQVIFSRLPKVGYKIGTVIRGPKPTKEMFDALKDLAKKERAIFIKLEPFVAIGNEKKTKNNKLIGLLQNNGCVKGKTLFTPSSFWIDLTKSEDELMKGFHSKTRYNIRYAKKKGVKVVEDNSDKAFEKYLELIRETVERQSFYSHTEKYHRLLWQHLHSDMIKRKEVPIAHLLTARYKNEIVTAWVVFTWQDFLFYPYGASTFKFKNVQANSAMMWEAIRFGKKLGLATFDLWGREEGKGFTKFKEGFNPKVVEFIGTWDLIMSPLYWPYRAAEFLRWQLLRTRSKLTKPKF